MLTYNLLFFYKISKVIMRNNKEDSMSYDYSFIGSEIRRIRKNRRISQKDLSNMVGISEESLRRIENNHNNPRVDNLLEILDVLGIDFEIILMDDSGSSWNLVSQQIKAIDNDLENLSLANLDENINKLKALSDHIPTSYRTKLSQYILYYQGIYEKDINKDFVKFKESLLLALRIKGKDLEKGFKNSYSDIEKRILIKLSEYYLHNNFKNNSKSILDYLIENIEITDRNYIDILYNLAKYYYMQDDFKKAINVCNKAIELSSQTNNYKRIILIYYLLGISKFKEKEDLYLDDIDKSLVLCDLLVKPDLKDIIKQSVDIILKEG